MGLGRIYPQIDGFKKNGSYGIEGAILMLHSVGGVESRYKIPMNQDLEISDVFLDKLIVFLKEKGYSFISLDEMARRIENEVPLGRAIVFTLDDGYRDNLTRALPVFQKHSVPFTIYVSTNFPDRTAVLWWLMLEDLVREKSSLSFQYKNAAYSMSLRGPEEKEKAWHDLRSLFIEAQGRDREALIKQVLIQNERAISDFNEHMCLSWSEIKLLSKNPLCTIGAHSITHPSLAHLPKEEMEREVVISKRQLEENIGKEVRHFCFPYGSPENCGPREFDFAKNAGFKTATTTVVDGITRINKHNLHSLPRIPVRGRYQSELLVELMCSGVEPGALFFIEDYLKGTRPRDDFKMNMRGLVRVILSKIRSKLKAVFF